MSRPIFYDPERRRWKRLRLITDPLGVLLTALIVFFVVSLIRTENLTSLSLPGIRPSYKSLKERQRKPRRAGAHRHTKVAPSQVELNMGEGIRAAYYVPWDEGSYSALKDYYPQIDLLFPEWLHVLSPDGRLEGLAEGNKLFDVVQGAAIHAVDEKHPLMAFLKEEKAQTEVFPLVNNFDPVSNQWLTSIGELLNDAAARAMLRRNLLIFLASDNYRGLSLDLEEIPEKAQPGFTALVAELAADLHARGMKLYLNLPPNDNDFDYAALAAASDGIILMNYDQHVPGTTAGPVAAQDWFTNNLQLALKTIPRQKLIVAIGAYGYDWALAPKQKIAPPSKVDTVTAQEAWLHAEESESAISLDADSLNPHYGYIDENDLRHEVWYLDAVTALNQMRAARGFGLNTFALWRLGAEDGSLWAVWDLPREPGAAARLRSVPPGYDVDLEGHGDVLRIEQFPDWGWRNLTEDADTKFITSEEFVSLPVPYQLGQYGWSKDKFAISFDDGPDPKFTPQILDILKQKNVKAAFFLIGAQAEKFPSLTERIFREGHEIGNHTFSHPDVSNLSPYFMRLEMNSTERLFMAKLGMKPVFFRPPYSIDEEPDTAEQVEPLRLMQSMGYITVGSKIDPQDWRSNPRNSAEQITDLVTNKITQLQPGCIQVPCGNIILLHDGGGNRSETVRALPMIIDALRARGLQIVPVAELLGRSREQVMLPLGPNERWPAMVDLVGFDFYGWLGKAIELIFILGNVLMTARLLIIGSLAIFERFHSRKEKSGGDAALPSVAILIPAFNEEKVIVNTVRAVLASDYPAEKFRVIMIDDGSSDQTVTVTREAFAEAIRAGHLLVITKHNAGKAEALNSGLAQVAEEIFAGIDADTVIAPAAIARLVTHFRDARVGAVAGNTKVGNRVNLWTRWQALEYITSQNFERRALDALGAVTVVPGALGAWRTEAVRQVGGFHVGTVAEDADLTMSLLQAGYRVEYEDRALAFTEAPTTSNGLMRQRFRWSFGILQAVWKHRAAFRRGGLLGWVALPNIAIFQLLLPVVAPFIDLMFLFGALGYFVDRRRHPLSANPADFERLVLYFLIFMVTDFIASAIAFSLERREPDAREDVWLLSQVWLQRFAYRQLFSLVLFKTLKRAIDGRPFSWDKLERSASVPAAAAQARAET